MRLSSRLLGVATPVALGLVVPGLILAQTSPPLFSDVQPNSSLAEAVTFLRTQNVITGYPDNTFRPDQKVNRAEAIKLVIAPLVKPEALATVKDSVYADVGPGDWFMPYVEAARQNGIIDGPPAKTEFFGARPVLKAEFIKMLVQANKIDAASAFGEIRLPLTEDVTNPDEWYYPYMRFAISSSMTMVNTDGALNPGRELTRGDTALLLYRLMMYRMGRRTQSLLSEAESEILLILQTLRDNNIVQAEYASARALLSARGAHLSAPNEPIVQGALKVTESFRALVRAYRAGLAQEFEETIRLSGEAWNLAARGKELSPTLVNLTDQVQTLAKGMADSARGMLASGGTAKP